LKQDIIANLWTFSSKVV